MKKLYISARSESAPEVRKLWELLKNEYEPAFDWTAAKMLQPETHPKNRALAEACIHAAGHADAFVLIDRGSFDGAFGAIFEFGAAASRSVPCVVVAPLTRESIFMTLDNVRIVHEIAEVPTALVELVSK